MGKKRRQIGNHCCANRLEEYILLFLFFLKHSSAAVVSGVLFVCVRIEYHIKESINTFHIVFHLLSSAIGVFEPNGFEISAMNCTIHNVCNVLEMKSISPSQFTVYGMWSGMSSSYTYGKYCCVYAKWLEKMEQSMLNVNSVWISWRPRIEQTRFSCVVCMIHTHIHKRARARLITETRKKTIKKTLSTTTTAEKCDIRFVAVSLFQHTNGLKNEIESNWEHADEWKE